MRERFAIRADRCGAARSDQRMLADDLIGPGRLGVVDDVGGIGPGYEQHIEDLGVQLAAHRRRDRGVDRVADELVAEADRTAASPRAGGAALARRRA